MSQSWIGHALRRARWQPQRQVAALAAMSMLVGIIIGALYLSQASQTSTLGRQLEEMIAQRNQLQQANEQIRAEIARQESVPRLLARAQELGFQPARRDQIEYLLVEGYNPNRGRIIIPVREEASAPTYDETFTGWLQQQWDALVVQFRSFSSRAE